MSEVVHASLGDWNCLRTEEIFPEEKRRKHFENEFSMLAIYCETPCVGR